MEPQIVLKSTFTVVGFSENGNGSDVAPEVLWNALSARFHEIPGADPDAGYGVHTWQNGQHHYLIGLAASCSSHPPVGMVARSFDPHAYAVFIHPGPISGLGATIAWIFDDWLPKSKFQWVADFYFEYYDDRFAPDSEDSIMFLFVPVKG